MTQIGTPENPVRVAIVGAGPSGFYAAEHILKDADTHAQVDLFDRLPTPFGLVRGDVARMLALTAHELRQTDTADHAIEMLDRSEIREIVVLGRRGPVQAAFTNPEIRELGEMEDADVIVDPAEVELDPASEAYLASDEADKTTRVNVETLREFSQR